MTEEETTQAKWAITALAVVGLSIYSVNLIRERKKRARIEAWKRENLACIENSSERLQRIVNDPNFDWGEFHTAMQEENAFLTIVRNQKY